MGDFKGQGEEDVGLSDAPLPMSAKRGFAALSRHVTSTGDVDVTTNTGLYLTSPMLGLLNLSSSIQFTTQHVIAGPANMPE